MITIKDIRADRSLIPDSHSVYVLSDADGAVYIGTASNPRHSRFKDYLAMNDGARTIRNRLIVDALRARAEAGQITTEDWIAALEVMALSGRLSDALKAEASKEMDDWTIEFMAVCKDEARQVEAKLIAERTPRLNKQRRKVT